MHLIPHEWRYLDNWRREMERFIEPLSQQFNSPRVDIFETETELVAECEIPGVRSKEDIHIDVANNVLNISGTIRRQQEVDSDSVHRRERYTGHFSRSVSLPVAVKADAIRASYRNGLLEVHMPKAQESKGRQIDIDFK